MRDEEISAVMRQLNRELITENHGRSLRPNRKGKPFTPWDINNGLCGEWAELIMKRLPGIVEIWETDFDKCDCGNHCFVRIRGRWYDAEATRGVAHYMDLPLFRRHINSSGSLRNQPVCRTDHNIDVKDKTYQWGKKRLGDWAEKFANWTT